MDARQIQIDQIIKNEIIAKSKTLSEEDITSYAKELNWDEFPDQLRTRLEGVLREQQEQKLSEQARNAIDGTLASIAWIKPRSTNNEGILQCPITLETFNLENDQSEIVALSDGRLYNAKAIAEWAEKNTTLPMDRANFTSGDHQRIKLKVPEYRPIGAPRRALNRALGNAIFRRVLKLFATCMYTAVIVALSFVGGPVAPIILATIIALTAAYALVKLGLYIASRIRESRDRNDDNYVPLPGEDEVIQERKEEPINQHRDLLRDVQARRNSQQPASVERVSVADVKEQKQGEKKRRASLPSFLFGHANTMHEDKTADEKKNERKRRFSQ